MRVICKEKRYEGERVKRAGGRNSKTSEDDQNNYAFDYLYRVLHAYLLPDEGIRPKLSGMYYASFIFTSAVSQYTPIEYKIEKI
jgi:hypothetical protein